MSIYNLQIITTLIVILWFDVFAVHRWILRNFFGNEWADVKPFSCYFCTHFWIGVCVAVAAGWAQWYLKGAFDYKSLIMFLGLNFIVARILDHLLGYESMKGK